MFFAVNKKGSYVCYDNEIRIYDENGKQFYFFDCKKSPHIFNLPVGVFYSKNRIKRHGEIIKYDLPKLPEPTRNVKPKENIKIIYRENPNKCSIDVFKGIIICDPSIKKLPKYFRKFIFYHEIGHHYWGGHNPDLEQEKYIQAEKNCDAFATKQMLIAGYNPSQCHIVVREMLNNWPQRVDFNFKLTKKKK